MFSKSESNGIRQSTRLKLKMQNTEKEVICRQMAYWAILPLEMKYKILSYIKVPDLAKFALSSKVASDVVLKYVQSIEGLNEIRKELESVTPCCENAFCIEKLKKMQSNNLGFLLKAVTMFHSTKERLTIIYQLFLKVHVYMPSLIENIFKSKGHLSCFGHFVHALINGWERDEISCAHNFLQTATKMEKYLHEVLHKLPGQEPTKEKFMREYYRSVYINPALESEKGFFLCTILKPLPYVHQAKLLFIIFGPVTHDAFIDWNSPLQTLNTYIPYELQHLATGTQYLSGEKLFSDDHVLTLIQEICAIPQMWHPLSMAHYIMSCGDKIVVTFMGNTLANGRYVDLGAFVLQCAATCLQLAKPLSSLIENLDQSVLSPEVSESDAVHFINFFPGFLRDVQMHTHHFGHTLGIDEISLKKTIMTIIEVISQRGEKICLHRHTNDYHLHEE